jgi:hypothetical protein
VSAVRLFAGQPERVHAERVLDGPAGVDLRVAATLRMPHGILAQFDVGLDLPRRDELELIGTGGKLVIFEATSAAIQDRGQPSFGRADAVAQATVLDALRRSGLEAAPVRLDRR